jgi:hypothetical protein
VKAILILVPLILFLALAAAAWALRSEPAVYTQPIAFNHAIHTEEGLGCVDCHIGAEDGPYATMPRIQLCMLCHEEDQGEHPDEAKLREYAAGPGAIPWVRVNRMAGHVYFSHEAHVTYAEMDCAECHGDMEVLTEPVTTSQIEHLTMERCMDCHAERRVSNDCLLCHK